MDKIDINSILNRNEIYESIKSLILNFFLNFFLKSKLFTIILSALPRTYLKTRFLNLFFDQPSGAELDLTIILMPNNLHNIVQ